MRRFRPLVRVGLPVAVAVALVSMAVINLAYVRTWHGEPEDGVLWVQQGANVVARAVHPDGPGARAGITPNDVLLMLDGREVTGEGDVVAALHAAEDGHTMQYVVGRRSEELPLAVALVPMPTPQRGLYYSLAVVGILAMVVGASVRLRRPVDPATLHFFWLTVAFAGALAFTASGRYDRLDYVFDWTDAIARFVLPPLFLHFAFVFPERPNPWARTDAGRAFLPLFYLPAVLLGVGRAALFARGLSGPEASDLLERIEGLSLLYLSACLLGGLAVMLRALTRLRSVTARRQLRWIMWGSAVGAVPFVAVYAIPFLFGAAPRYAEYTAVLLGCIPLAFASAIVRYRLMDVEVIIKKALVVAAVILLLAAIYGGTLQLARVLTGSDQEGSFWALLATLVVALVAPWLRSSIQTALDRLYYRDRYDYRRALVSFARDLNSELDLESLSERLVTRVRETLAIDRIALFLVEPGTPAGRFVPVRSEGMDGGPPPIERASELGSRLVAGQLVGIDDPLGLRRLEGPEAAPWRDLGLYSFIPCVSKETTSAVVALGRKADGELLSSEDMALLTAVAAQAATALENARLYRQVTVKAAEIERLQEFSESVVESLTNGLVVVDLEDRVLGCNRRLEALVGVEGGRAQGRRLGALFSRPFVDTLQAARRESPEGTTLYRVPLATGPGGRRTLLVNVNVSPLRMPGGAHGGWIIVLEDVTERVNLEEQLRLAEKMASIGLLAAGVAHEVNTPLTGISSFTQLLLERSGAEDPRRQLLEKIEQQTFRAAKIVNSLLNLARPSTGEAGPVDINLVVNDVLALLEHQFRMSRIQVRRDLAPGTLTVRGQEFKLQQVFLNLFLNARDAMPRGGWLSVSTSRGPDGAVVDVADTGDGIPAEHLSRIYDPFFTTKPEGRGTGLGLSVTYGIVQEHGGTLACESAVGHGTRFRLVLPLPADAPAEAAGG